MAAPAFRGVGRLSQGCNMYRCKEDSMSLLIHTALTNGNIPTVRGVIGLPGAMSDCGLLWRHLHIARSPGSCRHLREVRSGALESYGSLRSLWCKLSLIGPKASVAQMAHMFPFVLDSAEFSARSGTVPEVVGACHGTNQRGSNKHDHINHICACWIACASVRTRLVLP